MNRAYKRRIALSKANLDAELRAFARKIAHHGPDNLREAVRQQMNVAITAEYAAQLCKEFSQ